MTASVAFVTKAYAPDLERCELLCGSIEVLAPGATAAARREARGPADYVEVLEERWAALEK